MPGAVTKLEPQLQSPGHSWSLSTACKTPQDTVKVLRAATKTRHGQIIN